MKLTGPMPSGVAATRRLRAIAMRLPFLAALAGITGCSHDDGSAAACTTVEAFQRALQNRDPNSCRELLTIESQQALAEINWADVAEKKPLKVLSARREHQDSQQFLVDVLDPNSPAEPDTTAQFVVVREYGRLVVDLVATAGLTATVVEASATTGGPAQSSEGFQPRKLTPADHERIRKYELSQPPR